MMRRVTILLAATMFAAGAASVANAKSLGFCVAQNPEGFDPAAHITMATFDASSQMLYNRLVEFERGTTKLVPGLAETWDVNEDGTEYVFHLRANVKFHSTYFYKPTRGLNADDVVFSLKRQMDRKNPYFDYAGGRWSYFDGMAMGALISAVDKVDDNSVRIRLTRPDPAFLADMAMDFASIVSKEYADTLLAQKKRDNLDRMPIGTGPYQFVGYQPDAIINYRANPDYWRGPQAIDAISFQISPDPAERLKLYKARDCQIIGDPDAATLAALKDDAGTSLMKATALDVAYLAYNTKQKPFDDARVRKALNMAIDRRAIVAAVYGGNAVVARSPLPPGMAAHADVVADDAANPDAAKKALADAGVTTLKLKILTTTVARAYDPDPLRVANMIKSDLAKAGVEADVVSADLGPFIRGSLAADRDGAVLFGWTSDNGDPDNFLGTLLGCDTVGIANRALWCNQPFNEAVMKARTISSPEARAALYGDAQKAFADQAPWLAIAHTTMTVPVAKTVKNYVADPFGHHNFASVDIAE
ncbi:ABC transporter substrate-binding protein [soil metagenome]